MFNIGVQLLADEKHPDRQPWSVGDAVEDRVAYKLTDGFEVGQAGDLNEGDLGGGVPDSINAAPGEMAPGLFDFGRYVGDGFRTETDLDVVIDIVVEWAADG